MIGVNKWSKTLAGHDLCEEYLKEDIWGDRLLGDNYVLLEEIAYVY